MQYQFPIRDNKSLFFAARGPKVTKAILCAGSAILSVLCDLEQYDGATDLYFFGKVPFHCALAQKWNVQITLHVEGEETPSLVFIPAETTLTWEDVPLGIHHEDVTVGCASGLVDKTLVYTAERGGYKRT